MAIRIDESKLINRTGKTWDEWFTLIEGAGGTSMSHREIARELEARGVDAWYAQAITVQYEREHADRQPLQRGKTFTVTARRTIRRPIEQVFAVATEAGHLNQWFSPGSEVDLREGGTFSNLDNDSGTFLVVQAPHRVRFTWNNPNHEPGSVVEVKITETAPDVTVLALTHYKIGRKSDAEGLREGWAWAMDSLKAYVERGKGIPFELWRDHPTLKRRWGGL